MRRSNQRPDAVRGTKHSKGFAPSSSEMKLLKGSEHWRNVITLSFQGITLSPCDKRLRAAQLQTHGDQSDDYSSNPNERGGTFIKVEILQMERVTGLQTYWKQGRQDLQMDRMQYIREVKNDSKALGLSKMGKEKCHLLRCGMQGDKACFGRVAMLPDIQMKVQNRQVGSTTLEFREKSSSSISSFPFSKRWPMVFLRHLPA